MCGLFGWSLSPQALEEGCVHTLAASLVWNAERRGDDSWGVAKLTPTSFDLHRVLGRTSATCKVKSILAPTVLGHTRKATTGAITLPNAHPFHYRHIIGAHNGFVFNHKALNQQYQRTFEVDSQHIFAHLAEGRPLEELDGSGTVVYIHTDNPTQLYFGRGGTSDFALYGLGTPEHPYGLIWASLAHWVREACMMAGFEQIFAYDLGLRKQYKTEGYTVCEDGAFALTTHTRTEQTYPQQHGHGYWTNYSQNKSFRVIEKDDVLRLPKRLKKTSEFGDVDQWQTADDVVSPVEQCDSCHDWGSRVKTFEEDSEGVAYFHTVGQHLCFVCAAWWGSETGRPLEKLPRLNITRIPLP